MTQFTREKYEEIKNAVRAKDFTYRTELRNKKKRVHFGVIEAKYRDVHPEGYFLSYGGSDNTSGFGTWYQPNEFLNSTYEEIANRVCEYLEEEPEQQIRYEQMNFLGELV